eukprot:SAG22_NODE_2142_length_2946_cov_22.869687_3_plen_112_part_00
MRSCSTLRQHEEIEAVEARLGQIAGKLERPFEELASRFDSHERRFEDHSSSVASRHGVLDQQHQAAVAALEDGRVTVDMLREVEQNADKLAEQVSKALSTLVLPLESWNRV